MAFYGSIFTNETTWDRQPRGHARHIACPQRLKYIHDVKDGYIPYVEDFGYMGRTSCRNRMGLYNTADAWRQELMGLAQQVQTSLSPRSETRASQRRSKRIGTSVSTSRLEENDEQYVSKRLLSRRANTRDQQSYLPKLKIAIDDNEEETPPSENKKQDAGIWLLPMLCYILQVDNIAEAQEWLVSANPTEKRLAMELISRIMHDFQNHENELVSDSFISEQSSNSTNFNNFYWPYKFWQHQNQSRSCVDGNDTCERATSPVRFITPAKRLSVSSISNRSTVSTTDTRLSTPMPAKSAHSSRRGYRITTSDIKCVSANARGKTPLI